jgi:hypothetical protein
LSAGHSAADEAALYRLEAEQAEYIAETAREMHRRYQAAADTEARLGVLLKPLAEQGFHVLADRMWPGSTRANVDFVVVGPSGVMIVDAKSWADVHLASGRIFQGQDDVTERFENLRWLAEQTETTLADVGIAPGEVHAVAVFMGKRELSGRAGGIDVVDENAALKYLVGTGNRLNRSKIALALTAVERLFPPSSAGNRRAQLATGAAGTAIAAPGLAGAHGPAAADAVSSRLVHPDVVVPTTTENALITIEEIEAALHASVSSLPIEDWMTYLHPDQARLARRSFNGPSRIRGAAGTGKTVVGLHRAAYLARTRPGKILVTTLVRTLPVVLSSLMERMAPDIADRVEFTGVHAFAQELLRSRGQHVTVSGVKADRAFEHAWAAVGRDGILGRIDLRKEYWRDEVISVIKGRGLTRFEEYATLARIGRRRPLGGEARAAVWELHYTYNQALREANVHDFADVILLAEKSLRTHPLEGYTAVIADEAQDLSCAMIRMLHALVGDAPDGLNLIGDGQQTIYPGGYTLAEANVSLAGRGVVMTKNYRNTVEIADFAASVVSGDLFDDIEGEPSSMDVASEIVRHGARPRVSRFISRRAHDKSVVAQVRSLLASGVAGGDIAVLTQTNYAADDLMEVLSAAGIRTVDLHFYDGRTTSAVKVGTIKRAKGLEFKQVLVVRTPARLLEPVGAVEAAVAERRELDRRELYVAMTRARDGLWVGVG